MLSASSPSAGAVTAIARAGGMANLNVHFHSILPDGVFAGGVPKDAPPVFVALAPPTDAEVEALLLQIARRVERLVAQHAAERELSDEEPDALTVAQGESVMAPAAQRVLEAEHAARPKPRCAFLEGYSLHADVAVHENDRLGLERLCRYILRPSVATNRLRRTDDGLVRYRFRRPDAAGCTEILLSPEDFLARLATVIPPPRQHLLRYHGCFAPRSALRLAIVPRIPNKTPRRLARRLTRIVPSQPDSPDSPDSNAHPDSPEPDSLDSTPTSATHSPSPSDACPVPADSPSEPLSTSDLPATLLSRRLDWAGLLQRVFDIDVTRCAHCGGRVRILAVLAHPDIAHPVLEHLGLPTRLPAPAPARSPPQLDLGDWDPVPDDFGYSTP